MQLLKTGLTVISGDSSIRELYTRFTMVPIYLSIVKFSLKVLFAAETSREIDRSYLFYKVRRYFLDFY